MFEKHNVDLRISWSKYLLFWNERCTWGGGGNLGVGEGEEKAGRGQNNF